MERLLKIFGYIIGGVIGLGVIVYVSFWLMLEWHMRPRSYDRNDSEFEAIAMQPLRGFVCGSIPDGIRVTRYYEKRNFNDGDELWLLEPQRTGAVSELVALLKLKSVLPSEYVSQFAYNIDNKPDWVIRPRNDMKTLFIDADMQPSDGANHCKYGIFYLWSTDGNTFFLYHITT